MSRSKNGVRKTRGKFFEDSHEYREQKMAGKNARKFFEDIHEYRDQKNGGKNDRKFFIFTLMSRAKNGFKNALKIFLESNICREEKMALKKPAKNF